MPAACRLHVGRAVAHWKPPEVKGTNVLSAASRGLVSAACRRSRLFLAGAELRRGRGADPLYGGSGSARGLWGYWTSAAASVPLVTR